MASIEQLLETARERNQSFVNSNMHIRMKLAADLKGEKLGLKLQRPSLIIANLVELGYYFNSEKCEWVK
jgi:hypothetical protein